MKCPDRCIQMGTGNAPFQSEVFARVCSALNADASVSNVDTACRNRRLGPLRHPKNIEYINLSFVQTEL